MSNYLSENTKPAGNAVKLPNELRYANWDDLKSWGIHRLGTLNRYFCEVVIPDGWNIQPGPHANWQELVDKNNRVRADIYFCNDFAVTKAFLAMRRRFTTAYEFSEDKTSLRVCVMDGDDRMHCTDWIDCQYTDSHTRTDDHHDWQTHQKLEAQAKQWLASNFSGWQNCLNYWDLEF